MSNTADRVWRVALLHGGPSTEHDISLVSSKGVLQALRACGHVVVPVFVDRGGRWHIGGDDGAVGVALSDALALPEALRALLDLGVDVCFLGFHGIFGEDGRVQAALELAGLRYTGSGPLASALAMDKVIARRVYRGVGLPVAPAIELDSAGLGTAAGRAEAAARVVEAVGVPCVAKVAAGGSSVGVEIVRDAATLPDVLERLAPLWPQVLVERFVAGTELTCGILAGSEGEQSLPAVEIAPKAGRFFDYEVKYDPGLVEEIVPARISAAAEAEMRRLALGAHRALGCRGVSRTDAILDHEGAIWLLETNTLPGLTPASLLPKAAGAAGIAYGPLLERILAAAVAAPSA